MVAGRKRPDNLKTIKNKRGTVSFPFIFYYLCVTIWFRSSMDRMKDSGSFDWGSSPHGITKRTLTGVKSSKTFLNERFRKVFSFPMYLFGDKNYLQPFVFEYSVGTFRDGIFKRISTLVHTLFTIYFCDGEFGESGTVLSKSPLLTR